MNWIPGFEGEAGGFRGGRFERWRLSAFRTRRTSWTSSTESSRKNWTSDSGSSSRDSATLLLRELSTPCCGRNFSAFCCFVLRFVVLILVLLFCFVFCCFVVSIFVIFCVLFLVLRLVCWTICGELNERDVGKKENVLFKRDLFLSFFPSLLFPPLDNPMSLSIFLFHTQPALILSFAPFLSLSLSLRILKSNSHLTSFSVSRS